MTTSEDKQQPDDRKLASAGIGYFSFFSCGKCHKRSELKGSGITMYLGMRTKVCAKCKPKRG